MQRLTTNPLRLIQDPRMKVASPIYSQAQFSPHRQPPPPPPPEMPVPFSDPAPQHPFAATLNSRCYTDKFSLFLFLAHLVCAVGLGSFLVFKGILALVQQGSSRDQRMLRYFLPQVEVSSILSMTLAFIWQKAVRLWPKFMVHFIIWSSFILTLAAGILLICLELPPTVALGALFIAFAIGDGLYACWVTQRAHFCSKIFIKSLEPVPKFRDLNHPTYYVVGAGFLYTSLWIIAVIGSLNFYFPPLIIIALILSLAWTIEVLRNVANVTVSRVMALFYLRGIQSSTRYSFHRAITRNLGSASLGSLLVPTIEALRVVARGLNLLEGEDEFMFCCAHCCLNVMESIFSRGNGWAYVQIAAYGKGFVKASDDIWSLFQKREIAEIVNTDITSTVCFLSGICSGSICAIVVTAWSATVYRGYTASLAALAAFIGYLMMRISMALPQACVGCYYVCYAENPDSRLFDRTIKDRLEFLKAGSRQ